MIKLNPDSVDLERRRERFAELVHSKLFPPQARLTYDALARMAESLRKRYEATCSYPWANTPAYEKRTETAERKLLAEVAALGLHGYLQSDPRGATLYVDSQPICGTDYTRALCVYR